jgi:hypothetical protein
MFYSQIGHLMPITYLLPNPHLQSYNLHTYLTTHPPTYYLARCIIYLPTYLHIHPPITYLCIKYLSTHPPTHPPLNLYVLPTYLPTHPPKSTTYLHIHPPITYLHINYLPTYPPRCTTYLHIHPPITYLPTHPPRCTTYLPIHPPIFYNLPTFIPHSLVVKCQNKHVKLKLIEVVNLWWCGPLVKDLVYHWGGQGFNS